MKALDIIRIIMVVSVISVVHSMGIFFLQGKKIICECCVRTVTSLPYFEACPENGSHQARSNGLNIADLCKRKIEEDKTDLML